MAGYAPGSGGYSQYVMNMLNKNKISQTKPVTGTDATQNTEKLENLLTDTNRIPLIKKENDKHKEPEKMADIIKNKPSTKLVIKYFKKKVDAMIEKLDDVIISE